MSIEVKQGFNSNKGRSKSNNQSIPDKDQLDLSELEKDLNQLRRQYIEMKRERMKSQKDERLIKNKKRLLSKEEIKVSRRQQMYFHTQENMDKIKVNLLQDREKLSCLKKNRNEQLNERKREIFRRKSYLNLKLKSWRSNLELLKKNECHRTKEEQNDIQEKILLNKEAIRQRHQTLHDQIHSAHKAVEERKKKDEIDKKLQLKKEFEEKIMNEIAVKKHLDKNINDFQEESVLIVERIHSLGNMSHKNSFILKTANQRQNNMLTVQTHPYTHYSVNSSISKKKEEEKRN